MPAIGNGIGILFKRGAVVASLDADLVTYMAGLSTELSSEQQTLINTFILALKSGLGITNLSNFFDIAYIIGGETKESSYRNLVKRAHDITATVEPTWTALEGSQGNGSTQSLNTNYNPSTQGVNFTQNDGAIGVYSRTDGSTWSIEIGNNNAGVTVINQIYCRGADGKAYFDINVDDTSYVSDAVATGAGMFMATRNGSAITNLTGYFNKTSLITRTGVDVTGSIPNCNIYLLGCNNNGVLAAASARQLSFAFASKHVSTTHRDIIVDAFEAYMDANGKGVI